MDRRAGWKETLPADMAGIDQGGGPRSRAEARSVIEVITAMAVVPVGKGDLRPVPLLVHLMSLMLPFHVSGFACVHYAKDRQCF